MIKKGITKILISGFLAGGFIFVNAQGFPQIPSEVREQVPEKDLIEVYCLMTKWKTGEFFAALDSLDEVLIPALKELQGLGINVSVPDIDRYRSGGQAKLNEICSAQNYEAAETAIENFKSFGEEVRQKLGNLNGSLAAQLKTKGNEMRARVEKELNDWVEQEKVGIEDELQDQADQMANQMRTQLEQEMASKGFKRKEDADAYARQRAVQIKATVDAQIKVLAENKKKEIDAKVNQKATEILGVDAEKFKALGEKLQDIEGKINQLIAEKKKDYEVYKTQAMAKRKELILSVVNKNIETAALKIKEKEDLLDEARANDSSVKSADDYLAELQDDKEILADKIQAAVDSGDETAIASATDEMKDKWLSLREKLEKDLAKKQSAFQICSSVVPQITQAQAQIEQGSVQTQLALDEINLKKQECDLSPDKTICQTIETVYSQIAAANEKSQQLLSQIKLAEGKCSQVTEDTPLTSDFLDIMISLRNSGPEWKKEMQELIVQWQAEKSSLEKELAKKPKVKDICRLKEIGWAKTETQQDLEYLDGILNRCAGPCVGVPEACSLVVARCNFYGKKSDKFNSAKEKGGELLAKIEAMEQKCAAPQNLTLREIIETAREIQAKGKEFFSLYIEIVKYPGEAVSPSKIKELNRWFSL